MLALAGAGRAVAPTQTPLVSTHPPKIAIPLLGRGGSSSYGMAAGLIGSGAVIGTVGGMKVEGYFAISIW